MFRCNNTTITATLVKRCLNVQSLVLLSVILLLLANTSEGLRRVDLRSEKIGGPPKRPESFKSMAELNRYLTELAGYYTVIGRPRFGKRSGMPQLASDDRREQPAYSSGRLQRQQEMLMDASDES